MAGLDPISQLCRSIGNLHNRWPCATLRWTKRKFSKRVRREARACARSQSEPAVCDGPGPLVPSLTYEIPAGGPILFPGIVDRKADALTAPQLLADLVNRLMGLFTARLPGSCETNDLGLAKRPGCVTAPPLRDAPHIEDVADPLPAVGVDLPEDLDLSLEVLRNRLAA